MTLPSDKLWLLYKFVKLLVSSIGSWGQALTAPAVSDTNLRGRQRDIFPLSHLEARECKLPDWSTQRWSLLRPFVNAVIGALNWCYAAKPPHVKMAKRSSAQQEVLDRIVARCVDFCQRLQLPSTGCWEPFVPDWVPLPDRPSGQRKGNLCAAAVDVLACAGCCDPIDCLPDYVKDVVSS